MNLLLRRLLAGVIDYGVVLTYAGLLFLLVTSILSLESKLETSNPVFGQLIGFISLTLPVFFYFYWSENGKRQATIGKQLTNIRVQKHGSSLKRNILKFLPWEIAHTGVHWIYYYSNNNAEIPIWVWLCLLTPQIIVLIYFLSIIITKGEYSIYDKFARTKITNKL